jgi:hypothetical protein
MPAGTFKTKPAASLRPFIYFFWRLSRPLKNTGKHLHILRAIKMAHTVIWAFFVLCIIAIPVYGHLGQFFISGLLAGFVLLECFVLFINRLRCPLTDVAARYTDVRKENFDIYLPLWLAKFNKEIFGVLFAAGSLYALFRWWFGSGNA